MVPETFLTDRLILRPVAPPDAPGIFDSYAQDREVTRFLIWQPHKRITETEAYIAHCMAATSSRTYVLVGRDDATIHGALDLRQPEPHHLTFGYVLARAWWGRGLMTEALTEVVRWAMTQDPIWRIGAVCDVENRASARVMEKAGLLREGLLHRWLVHPNISDEPRDCYSFAKTR
jgi:RimJ/RimL family protein N-acetyltransferase